MKSATFEASRNLSREQIAELIKASRHKAVRRVIDNRKGDQWYWRAELATHAEGAEKLGVTNDERTGQGDILTLE